SGCYVVICVLYVGRVERTGHVAIGSHGHGILLILEGSSRELNHKSRRFQGQVLAIRKMSPNRREGDGTAKDVGAAEPIIGDTALRSRNASAPVAPIPTCSASLC